jgi:hypothetical protein
MGQVITITSGSSIRNEVTVVATAWANACGHASQGELPANAGMLVIDVVSTGPLAGGTYPIAGNGLVKVFFRTVDMTCTETTRVVAQSGTVTYTKADLSSIAGSVDAVFPGGDHLTGQFVAPLCNALGASPSTCP